MRIIDTKWYSPLGQPCIGIVLADTGIGLKAYIGIGTGFSEEADVSSIVAHGARFRDGEKLWPNAPTFWAT